METPVWMGSARPDRPYEPIADRPVKPTPRNRRPSRDVTMSTCVEPDHRELIRSVSSVLQRRVRDNESAESKAVLPLFCEDTHTDAPTEDRYDVCFPSASMQSIGLPTLFDVTKLPPPEPPPRAYPVPDMEAVFEFVENIWHKARLTPQSLVICLVYVDRVEARADGVMLHARSWRPVVFAALLLASKVWHDVSYWNSDFSTICPMFNLRNINRMERAFLQLLQYDTIISASQYASYYFALRAAHARQQEAARAEALRASTRTSPTSANTPTAAVPVNYGGGGGNFRSKYLMAVHVPGGSRLQERSSAIAQKELTGAGYIEPSDSGVGEDPGSSNFQDPGFAEQRRANTSEVSLFAEPMYSTSM